MITTNEVRKKDRGARLLRVIVTGVAGLIGSWLAAALIRGGHDVLLVQMEKKAS